jgi:hypothetical protein
MQGAPITLFIIFGVFLVISSSIILYNLSDELKESEVYQLDVNFIKNYVNQCLEIASEKAIWSVGMQIDSNEFLSINSMDVPIYNKESDMTVYYLNQTIASNFDDCFILPSLSEMGLPISDGLRHFDVTVNNRSVFVRLNYPLVIEYNKSTYKLDNFEISHTVKLGEFMHLLNKIALYSHDISLECDMFDSSTNAYIFAYNSTHSLIRLIDYSTYNNRYAKSFIFQRGVARADIEGSCMGA